MNPNKMPVDRASATIKDLAAARRPSFSACNCGWYGFKSTVCPHHGVQTDVKCGLSISDKTHRPVFCPKKAPIFTLPEHVVAKPCKDCKLFHNTPANANQASPNGTAQNSTATPSNNGSSNPNQTPSFT